MSTYWGYVCRSHDPELESEKWLNHGDGLLADVYRTERAGEWPARPPYEFEGHSYQTDEPGLVYDPDDDRGYGWTGIVPWLRYHPRCDVALRNEYGDTKEITP